MVHAKISGPFSLPLPTAVLAVREERSVRGVEVTAGLVGLYRNSSKAILSMRERLI